MERNDSPVDTSTAIAGSGSEQLLDSRQAVTALCRVGADAGRLDLCSDVATSRELPMPLNKKILNSHIAISI